MKLHEKTDASEYQQTLPAEPAWVSGVEAEAGLQAQAAESFRQSEERFPSARGRGQGIRHFLIALDTEGRVIHWNAGAERLKGYRAKEILGEHFSCFYPKEDKEKGKPDRELKEAAAKGRVEDEGWRVRKDGSIFWANVIITALHDQSGNLVGFSKLVRDSSERKREMEELRQSEAQFRAFFELGGMGAAQIEVATGRLIRVNDRYCEITGYSREESSPPPFAN